MTTPTIFSDSAPATLGKAFDVSNWSGTFNVANPTAGNKPFEYAPYRPLSVARPAALASVYPYGATLGLELGSATAGPSAAQAIKDLGYSKAIIGSQNEAVSRAQAQACLNVGLPVDAYVYLLFAGDPVAQVTEAIRRFDGLQIGMLWIDCEDAYADNLTEKQTVDFIGRATQACENKIWSGIYTAGWWWTKQTGDSTAFSGFKLWHASADRVGDLGDVSYGGWSQLYMEQYQFDTLVAGVNTDLNVYRLDTPAPQPDPQPQPEPHTPPTVEISGSSITYSGFNADTKRDEYVITQKVVVS